jgi:methionyl-tRNA formyltransferase
MSQQTKILFLCSSRFAIAVLQELAFTQRIAAVVIPAHCDEMIEHVTAVLNGTNIPIIKVTRETVEKELIKTINKYEVNVGIIMTFSFLIPKAVYALPAKGFFNIHPGPLPQYRGADPIFQQLKNREKNAGVTIHKVDGRFDTGAVVIKELIKIDDTDTYGILTSKLSQVATRLTRTLTKMISFDFAVPAKEQDEATATYYKKQSSSDVIINWTMMDADTIVALINACNPWNKGAITRLNNKIIRLLEAEKLPFDNTINATAGAIISINDNGLRIATNDNETINIAIIYIDEGFITAKRLTKLKLLQGNQFDVFF